jgi:hypothetical protein
LTAKVSLRACCLQQQARFDAFRQEFNTERPHEALAMRCPDEVYSASTRPYDGMLSGEVGREFPVSISGLPRGVAKAALMATAALQSSVRNWWGNVASR